MDLGARRFGSGEYLKNNLGEGLFGEQNCLPPTSNTGTSIGAMSLTYDATGRKWKKDGEFGAVLYDNSIEYRDGQLEAINLPDGRLVAEYSGGPGITRYRAEYFHQDHLGNARLGFSDFNEDSFIEINCLPTPPQPLSGLY